jgi:NADH-quinone oxidoreductase subunit D
MHYIAAILTELNRITQGQPYSGYEQYEYMIRMEEMRQAVRIIRQAADRIPGGPIMAKVPKIIKPPVGEVCISIEAPKGELGYYVVSDGSLDKMVRGVLVADCVASIGTLDIVLGEVD